MITIQGLSSVSISPSYAVHKRQLFLSKFQLVVVLSDCPWTRIYRLWLSWLRFHMITGHLTKSSSFYTPPAEGPWTWKWMALAYSIPTVSVLYPGPPAQGSQQPRSEFCVDVWGHLGSPSSPWVICKEPFGIKQNGRQSYLREVIRQLMTAL